MKNKVGVSKSQSVAEIIGKIQDGKSASIGVHTLPLFRGH